MVLFPASLVAIEDFAIKVIGDPWLWQTGLREFAVVQIVAICSGQIKLLTFLRDFRQLFVAFLLQTLFQIQQGLAHLKHYALFGSYTSLSTGQFWLSSA